MGNIIALDYYTSKYIQLDGIEEKVINNLNHRDMVVYYFEMNGKNSLSIGEYICYDVKTDRKGEFQKILDGKDRLYFEKQQQFAKEVFPVFKKSFKEKFEGSKPINARFHIYSNQVYFYFYSEERYIFSEYVKWLRQEIGKNIFLFQVGARDMVRLSPCAKDFLTIDGRPLHASMSLPLPSVPMGNISLQSLEGRDIERLKGWSGKLKESIAYETDLYLEESKKYPEKGSNIEIKNSDIKGVCMNYNIMNKEVLIKTEDENFLRYSVDDLNITKYATDFFIDYSEEEE